MGVVPEFLAKQFRKPRCEDFPGVLVPLDQADRRPSTVSSTFKAKHDGSPTPPDGDEETRAFASSSGGGVYTANSIEALKAEVEADEAAFGSSSTYDKKSKLINKAIQDMGMGRYQWQMFVLCGFGWFADNFWLQGVALTLPQLSNEFGVSSTHVRFTTMAVFVGLCVGASFWGIASDVVGRRLAFNTTLFIGAVFGLAVGGAPNWIAVSAMFACVGVGVGGNLPVDGALFLEFLPFASGNLLTLLSIWWPLGALLASMIAYGLIPKYSCGATANRPACPLSPNDPNCTPCGMSQNMGWRYFTLTLGCITLVQWFCRFFLFQMFESPKFLLSRGRQEEAVAVIHGLAYKNKMKTWLTVDILNEVGGDPEVTGDTGKLTVVEIIQRQLSKFSTQRIAPLFKEWKLGLTTGLLWFQWCSIGMAYPLFNAFLPQYIGQSTSNVNIIYRNYAITTVVGVPGSALAYWTVNVKYIGRKGTMSIATLVTGIFVYMFTLSKHPNFQLAFSALEAFFQNIMYGVLYAYTPEVFPAPNRGTGSGISSFVNRIGGLCAPIVGIYAATNPLAPIYASGGLFIAAFLSMLALPIETRGKQSL